jgi:hydrogenase maturation protease
MSASTLVFAWGNPRCGDDALGPVFLERVESWLTERGRGALVDLLTDFSLQPEHAADLDGRALALFVDASTTCEVPFAFSRVPVRRDASFTSHAMSPAAVLAAYEQAYTQPAPPCYALAIRGHGFELGEPLGNAARRNLEAALAFAFTLLERPCAKAWERMACNPVTVSKGL